MSQAKQHRVVVMTGATGGFGACAAQQIAAKPDTQLIIGARGVGRTVPSGAEVIPLDLASLTSVREFAARLTERLNGA
ncbi:MAG TPA: hypothetical protein VLF16_00870, partial [Pseudomonas sp.]|nr:hypothetical protein [Pseudomonas sp.]